MDYGDDKKSGGFLVGDMKRIDTDDSDVEKGTFEPPLPPLPAARRSRFSLVGWDFSANTPPRPPPVSTRRSQYQIPRKPVRAPNTTSRWSDALTLPSRRSVFVGARLDEIIPRNRRYCFGRLSRRALLILVGVLFAILLAICIGVGVAVSKHHGPGDLPLPTDASAHTGDLTYYMPGLGACGITSKDTDHIVAVSHYLFDAVQKGSDPNSNPLCGKKIRATRFDSTVNAQRSVDVTVVDRCVGCQPDDLDVTTAVFDQLADEAQGRVGVTWAWLDYESS